MNAPDHGSSKLRWAAFAPLRDKSFAVIWSASLLSNFGQLIQGVGAAWAMTQLTDRVDMVALVPSASFAPMMLLSLNGQALRSTWWKAMRRISKLPRPPIY